MTQNENASNWNVNSPDNPLLDWTFSDCFSIRDTERRVLLSPKLFEGNCELMATRLWRFQRLKIVTDTFWFKIITEQHSHHCGDTHSRKVMAFSQVVDKIRSQNSLTKISSNEGVMQIQQEGTMKTFNGLVIAFVLSPAFAFACPDLAANYKCKYKSFTRAVQVTQAKNAGVTVYQVDGGGEIFADGKLHQTDTLHPLLDMYASNYNYTATCSGNAVKIEGTADVNSGTATVNGELLKTGVDLAIGMKLVTPTRTMDITLACTKN